VISWREISAPSGRSVAFLATNCPLRAKLFGAELFGTRSFRPPRHRLANLKAVPRSSARHSCVVGSREQVRQVNRHALSLAARPMPAVATTALPSITAVAFARTDPNSNHERSLASTFAESSSELFPAEAVNEIRRSAVESHVLGFSRHAPSVAPL
jgi:hypothetical protein